MEDTSLRFSLGMESLFPIMLACKLIDKNLNNRLLAGCVCVLFKVWRPRQSILYYVLCCCLMSFVSLPVSVERIQLVIEFPID